MKEAVDFYFCFSVHKYISTFQKSTNWRITSSTESRKWSVWCAAAGKSRIRSKTHEADRNEHHWPARGMFIITSFYPRTSVCSQLGFKPSGQTTCTILQDTTSGKQNNKQNGCWSELKDISWSCSKSTDDQCKCLREKPPLGRHMWCRQGHRGHKFWHDAPR